MMFFALLSAGCRTEKTESAEMTAESTVVASGFAKENTENAETSSAVTEKASESTASATKSTAAETEKTRTVSTETTANRTIETQTAETTAVLTENVETTTASAETETTSAAPKKIITRLDSDLPVLYITGNVAAISENPKGHTEACTYELVSSDGSVSGNMTLKGRGNTAFRYAKKCFKIKLEEKQDFLGMGKSKHWVLIANWTDGSFMRNHLAYTLSGDFGLVSMDGTWVDVVVNGQYYGNYYLCEHIRTAKDRIDIETVEDDCEKFAASFAEKNKDSWLSWIPEDHLAAIASENLSWISTDILEYAEIPIKVSDYYGYTKEDLFGSGYLLEIDSGYNENSKFMSSMERPVMVHEPEWVCGNEEMMGELAALVNAFEAGLLDGTFETEYKGEKMSVYDIFDIDSLVAYFWVQEIFMNTDGWHRSTYFYKDANDADGTLSKFKMGPVWDMDFSSGGMRDSGEPYPTDAWGFREFTPIGQADTGWHKYLIRDPVFQEKVYEFYKEHRADIQKMIDSIDGYEEYLAASVELDKSVWGVWRQEFPEEVSTLKNWLQERIAWLDSQTESLEVFLRSIGG